MYLFEQGILAATIGFFGVLSASFIAAIALLYINKQTQTYSWRRDQALKDIETIYEPLYRDISKVVKAMGNFIPIRYESSEPIWNSINHAYLGTKLELMDSKLHGRLKTLFEKLENYDHRLYSDGVKISIEILEKLIEPHVDKSVQDAERRQQICHEIANYLDFVGDLSQGFLVCESVGEWALLRPGQSEEEFIESLQQSMREETIAQHLQHAIE